jgi:hypothetical protein
VVARRGVEVREGRLLDGGRAAAMAQARRARLFGLGVAHGMILM